MTIHDNYNGRCDGFYTEPRKCFGSLRKEPNELTVFCDQCSLEHPRYIDIKPPWSFSFRCKPRGRKSCPDHNLDRHKGNLTDFDIVKCNAGTVGYNPYLLLADGRGKIDQYQCSWCHKQFDFKCIHGCA